MPTFAHAGETLYYKDLGDPAGVPLVLTHGLLWSIRMLEPLAALLPDRRVLLLDLHGHGRSTKPADPSRYTWDALVDDVAGLLDHLGIDQAAVGGLSLGANVALAMGQRRPSRCRALILEMPVLLRGHRVGRPAFTALAATLGAGAPALGAVARLAAKLPLPGRAQQLVAMRDLAAMPPRVGRAILTGLLAEPPLPEDEATLAALDVPTLVIGHGNDPLHVLDDARDLAARLPRSRLVEVPSILTHRRHPALLSGHVARFLDDVETGKV